MARASFDRAAMTTPRSLLVEAHVTVNGRVPRKDEMLAGTALRHPNRDNEPVSDFTKPLGYRLITGPDDAEFCARVSGLLDQGYQLHGSPALTFGGERVIAAQALVLPRPVGSEAPVGGAR
ncbi:DUF1737 domain-containing protein [Micromonospora trifolii]|uniref:DUF1737 domain-containing protein n=1 Tax=Micromonospora trifolii TaxID=2911208 RepID=UPI003D2F1C34